MEKGQSEVTNKIRSAIKEKLAEISDFVDDELPEYIMILVANQRSKSQIEKDLSLFLRNDTVNFTNWLWELLNNLKVCTKNNLSTVSKVETNVQKVIETDEDALVLEFDPAEHETDFLINEDTNDSILSKSPVRSSFQNEKVKEPVVSKLTRNCKEPVVSKSNQSYKQLIAFASKSFQSYKTNEKGKTETKSLTKVRKNIPSQVSKEPLSSAVVPVKRKIASLEDEYNPDEPQFKKSSYSTNTRKYGGTAALQANKLLLKAVDDATKSILDGKNVEDFYKPTPIKVLTSKGSGSPSSFKNDNVQRKEIAVQEMIPQPNFTSDVPDITEFEGDEYPSNIFIEEEDVNYDNSPRKSRTICMSPVPLISNNSGLENMEYTEGNDYSYSFAAVEEVRPNKTHFIVTLDGVTRTTFKRKLEDDSVDSMEDDYETDKDEPSADEAVTTPEKKLKLNERCKYWPACKNSDQCSYHHPTVACKCFPDCKFGDKCLYIHPNCKFDALCSRKDCPFTHASKRKLPFIAVPVKMVPVKSRKMRSVCKFYPNCFSKNCPFIHPKLCRYGTDCRLPMCVFGHFPVPCRSQMKWHATV